MKKYRYFYSPIGNYILRLEISTNIVEIGLTDKTRVVIPGIYNPLKTLRPLIELKTEIDIILHGIEE